MTNVKLQIIRTAIHRVALSLLLLNPFWPNRIHGAVEDLLLNPSQLNSQGAQLPHTDQGSDRLSEFIDEKSKQKFTGKPITLQVRNADISDVLRMISEASGFNIIIGNDVKGTITLSLIEVPWDQALDVVLHTLRLGAERSNNILRIMTLSNLASEKLEEKKAEDAAQARSPKVTRVFPINYAEIGQLTPTLKQFLTSSNGSNISTNSIVQADNRTNSIIIYDTIDHVERAKKLIEILDTQTPQVIIEAKIIEATEQFTRSLSGSLGLGGASSTSWFGSFAGGDPFDPLLGSPGVFANGAAISQVSSPSSGPIGSLGLSPNLSFIPGVSQLNALLNWGESESLVKIVSSPKTVVLNKQSAYIVEGTPVLVPMSSTAFGGAPIPISTVKQALLSLKVTPTVTNDGGVLLNLYVTKDVPVPVNATQSGIGQRNLQTQVLVDSGSTLVIGGIYVMQKTNSSAGFPILKDIPIIGALFGSKTNQTQRSELFIFVTPKILNPKEAGLTS